jgi:hypothetical protein
MLLRSITWSHMTYTLTRKDTANQAVSKHVQKNHKKSKENDNVIPGILCATSHQSLPAFDVTEMELQTAGGATGGLEQRLSSCWETSGRSSKGRQ